MTLLRRVSCTYVSVRNTNYDQRKMIKLTKTGADLCSLVWPISDRGVFPFWRVLLWFPLCYRQWVGHRGEHEKKSSLLKCIGSKFCVSAPPLSSFPRRNRSKCVSCNSDHSTIMHVPGYFVCFDSVTSATIETPMFATHVSLLLRTMYL